MERRWTRKRDESSVASITPEQVTERNELVLRLLDETREELGRADSKASLLIAAIVAGTGAALGGLGREEVALLRHRLVIGVLFLVGIALIGGCVMRLVLAIRPSLVSSTAGDVDYFADVARCASPEMVAQKLELTDEQIRMRHARQLWVLSHVVLKRYKAISSAMSLLGLGALVAIAALAIAGITS